MAAYHLAPVLVPEFVKELWYLALRLFGIEPGSPAVDRGATGEEVDQRGFERPFDGDGDGISDAVEKASLCPKFDDADTDDDGILDGNEDADHDGTVDASETDPCETDTDNDGLLDGTEIGLTAPQGLDTNLNVFVPDADPTTTTNPLDEDSDDDGRLDGEEDANQNGQVDAGETDPSFLSAGALPAILPLLLGD